MYSHVYTNQLMHWGIKGQKWGIRRFQNKDGSRTPLGKKRREDEDDDTSENTNQTAKTEVKTSSGKSSKPDDDEKELTDNELREKVNRIRLEKEYDSLVNPPKPTVVKKSHEDLLREQINRIELENRYAALIVEPKKNKKGKDFVMRVLEKSGENIATQATTAVMGTIVNKIANGFNYQGEFVNPKKGQKDK